MEHLLYLAGILWIRNVANNNATAITTSQHKIQTLMENRPEAENTKLNRTERNKAKSNHNSSNIYQHQ
jgi:hypothetical protein